MKHKISSRVVMTAFGLLCAGLLQAQNNLPSESFETADTGGWQAGAPHPAPPITDVDCGNQGVGDGCLRIRTVTAGGPGSRLGAYNDSDAWTGDYVGRGISSIRLYARNTGFQELNLRLRFQGAGGDFLTREALVLPPNGPGQTFTFSIMPEDLEPLNVNAAQATLQDTFRMWIYHNPLPSFPPPAGPYSVAIDDLTALGVVPAPDPVQAIPSLHELSAIALAGITALLGLIFVRRRNRIQ